MIETKKGYKDPKDVRNKMIHLGFSENDIEEIDEYVKESSLNTRTAFIRDAISEKINRIKNPELFYLKIKYEKKKVIEMLENFILQLNLIAWEYVSEKGVLQYKERYYNLQNTQIWFLGLNIRERLDKLKGIIPNDAKMSDYSFHHEPPYRKHWHTIFTTGEFKKKHKQGSMKNSLTKEEKELDFYYQKFIKKTNLTKEEVNALIQYKKVKSKALMNDLTALFMIADDLGFHWDKLGSDWEKY